ncbi:restriction endonuclease subunit M [candidate division MSBL1 archaeon SCGC-AAA259E17]|uniref:site-specific DNA-methyltransferase (adenine-specific) n=1 Tax=candidate division MSBL1 archaeon SCGC-AAA259E17 TaxID=1698263 RepID=A0A133UEG4_9EURY|nr:restriction endonuclease subunit M [candidate division MSBL1 archaeon SCGC-AAA259E17]
MLKLVYDIQPSSEKGNLSRSEIESILMKAADLIRTRVDYKYILILLFLKRLSDKWEIEYQEAYDEALEDGLAEEEARVEAKRDEYHDFNFPEKFLWDNLREDVDELPERLSEALRTLGELNPNLKDVVDRSDFIQFTESRENFKILRQLVELFSQRKFYNVSPDVLGNGYEWVLHHFAPEKAKEGEVYTPREVIKLLIEILDPKPLQSVYDPASGSGGMLISAYNHVKEEYGEDEARKLFLYGQEANRETLALSKMNMFIHEIRDVKLNNGDTLLYPKYRKNKGLKKFDFVVANPPWNQKGYGEDELKDGDFWKKRYTYGFPTANSADWAWIQHMVASAEEDGKVGVVIDNGVLFRSWGKKIRRSVLEDDLIECVILLPEKLFYNTGAPGTILVFNKDKPKEKEDKVLFINASDEYEDHPEVRKLNILADENIEKIAEAYRGFENKEGFSRVVPLEEIRENDYNLNVTLYVFPEIEREDIDIEKTWQELKKIEENINQNEFEIQGFLNELS